MSTIDFKKIIAYLQEKWGNDRACPMCGHSNWNVPENAFQLTNFKEGVLITSE